MKRKMSIRDKSTVPRHPNTYTPTIMENVYAGTENVYIGMEAGSYPQEPHANSLDKGNGDSNVIIQSPFVNSDM